MPKQKQNSGPNGKAYYGTIVVSRHFVTTYNKISTQHALNGQLLGPLDTDTITQSQPLRLRVCIRCLKTIL